MKRMLNLLVTGALAVATVASAQHAGQDEPRQGGGNSVVIVDTLGTATPGTTFSVSLPHSGIVVAPDHWAGPQFTLTTRSVVTSFGAFVENCGYSEQQPPCADRLPFVVQIRRAVNGAPDPQLVVAAKPLTDDGDPSLISFETASFHGVVLEPGTYFALIVPMQVSDRGILLAGSETYTPGVVEFGGVSSGVPFVRPPFPMAVRIMARPVKRRSAGSLE